MKDLQTKYTAWLSTATPLGELESAGVILNSRGTGFSGMRQLDVYIVLLVVGTGGRYRDGTGADIRLNQGDCLTIPAGLPHQYGPETGDRWDEIYITVRGDVFTGWFKVEANGEWSQRVWPLGDLERWLPRWLKITRISATSPGESVQALAEIHLLLNDITRYRNCPSDIEAQLDETRHLVGTWPTQTTPDWERLARMCHCSYETWRKAFRRAYGEPPARYRRRILMEQAAEMLRRTTQTNEQLADHFGCADAFHFSKMFKAVHGCPPSVFRKQLKSNQILHGIS